MLYDSKMRVLDGQADISTPEKIKDIIDNVTPIDEQTGAIWTVNTDSLYFGARHDGVTQNNYSSMEHFSSLVLEYDGVNTPVVQQAYTFEETTGNTSFEMVSKAGKDWQGTMTSIRTSNVNKRLWDGETAAPFIDKYGYSAGV